jgi:hypothetical protein
MLKMLKDNHVFHVKWKKPSTSTMYLPLWSVLNITIWFTSLYMFHVNNSSRLNELLFFSFICFYSKENARWCWACYYLVEICYSKIIEPILIVRIVINGCKIGDWMKKFYFHFPSLFNNRSSIGLVCIMLNWRRLQDYMWINWSMSVVFPS